MNFTGFITFLKDGFSLDKRSLALARVVLGASIFFDIWRRSDLLELHYTSSGYFPKDVWFSQFSNPSNFTFHLLIDQTWWVQLLFIIHGLLGLSFLLGFKTRWVNFFLWVFYFSLNNRNWYLNDSGDDALRIFLMLSFFLPMGARYSIDSFLTIKKSAQESVYHWINLAVFLQLSLIYFVSALLKSHPSWTSNFTAVSDVLKLDIFVSEWGVLMRNFPRLNYLATFGVYGLELLGPLLLWLTPFLGFRGQYLRFLLVICFMFFHIGIILFMQIGTFPFFMLGIWSMLIPSLFWEELLEWLKTPQRLGLEVYYDGQCGFCKKLATILKGFFLIPETKLAVAQSDPEIDKIFREQNTWVVKNYQNEKFIKFSALIVFFGTSPLIGGLANLFKFPPIFILGTRIYEWVATHRILLGKFTRYLTWEDEEKEFPFFHLDKVFVLLFCLTILQLNLKGEIRRQSYRYSKLHKYGRKLGIYQNWGMFSPYVQIRNSWFVSDGIFLDESRFDLWQMQKVDFEKPKKLLSLQTGNKQQRKFLNTMESDQRLQEIFSTYYCRKYLELKNFKLFLVTEGPVKNIEHKFSKVCR